MDNGQLRLFYLKIIDGLSEKPKVGVRFLNAKRRSGQKGDGTRSKRAETMSERGVKEEGLELRENVRRVNEEGRGVTEEG